MAHGDAEEIIRERCTSGAAVVRRADAPFYAAAMPADGKRLLATYPPGARVTLLGACYLGWVKVQPVDSVTPGWMFAPDLRLESAVLAQPEAATTDALTTTAVLDATASPDMTSAARTPQVVPLTPAAPTAAGPALREALTVAVRLTDADKQPLAGVRVQLVDAFGAPLAEGVTASGGDVTLPIDLAPDAAIALLVPALGVTLPIDRANPTVAIVVPREREP
jgi:hypothetical protein